jgi:hypothetical protein
MRKARLCGQNLCGCLQNYKQPGLRNGKTHVAPCRAVSRLVAARDATLLARALRQAALASDFRVSRNDFVVDGGRGTRSLFRVSSKISIGP